MFCQKYMAAEITQLQHYSEGRLSDSLVEVFHKMDLMLADNQYSEVLLLLCKLLYRQAIPALLTRQ